MKRRRLGAVRRHGDHYDIRITTARGKKSSWTHLPPDVTEAEAEAEAERLTLAARRGELRVVGQASTTDTVHAWFMRWFESREAEGITSVAKERGRFAKWAASLAKLRMSDVRREDLEDLVERLDAAATAYAEAERRGERPETKRMLSWKSAINVWAIVKQGFDDAVSAKRRSLRCLSVSPAADVRGPDRGVVKLRSMLSPARFLAFVSAREVPIEWRTSVTLAVYTLARQSELRGVRWRDVHEDELYMDVHETLSADGRSDSTKTDAGRRISIEPTLVPLLRVMRGAPSERAFSLPDDRHMARGMRVWLSRLGLDDGDLSRSATKAALTWHDLRGTGVTWRAIRGDNPYEIQAAAGHARFSTTEKYIRLASVHRAGFKGVFPELPESLLADAAAAAAGTQSGTEPRARVSPESGKDASERWSGRWDLNIPRTVARSRKRAVSAGKPAQNLVQPGGRDLPLVPSEARVLAEERELGELLVDAWSIADGTKRVRPDRRAGAVGARLRRCVEIIEARSRRTA